MENNVYLGKTDIDWNGVLNNASNFAAAYLGYRATVKAGQQAGQGGGGQTVVYQPTPGMSNTTRALLIGGGILVAGLVVYSLTKKKDGK